MNSLKHSDNLTVKAACADDLAFLADAEETVFSDAWSKTAIASHMNASHNLSLVARLGGTPVGFLFAAILPPEGELYRIAVLPTYRKNAVGRALLSAFHDRLRECGVTRAFLEVRANNAAAIALYRSFGYEECGIRKGYYRNPTEDALLFSFDLSAEKMS